MVPLGECSDDYDNYNCACNAAFDSPYKPDGSVIDAMCNGKSEKQFLLLKQHETCLMNSILEMLNNFKEIVFDEESSNEFLRFHICIVLLKFATYVIYIFSPKRTANPTIPQ